MDGAELKGVMAGAGYFAAFQGEAWTRLPGVKIAAVADTDEARARQFAARWGIPAVYTSVADMLARERPAFLDIVTPPATHPALTEMAAAAGVNVICQKPMAPEPQQCLAMVEACEKAGVRLLVHENWRWQPWYREIKRLIDAGRFGRVFYLGFRLRCGDGRGPQPYPAQPYFRDMERLLVYETLIHFLDTFRFLAGELRSVFCRTARVNPVIRGEDCALIQMVFGSGAQGLIDANRISGPPQPDPAFGTFRLEGERGMVRMAPDGRLFVTEHGGQESAHDYAVPQLGYRGDSVRAFQEHALACLRSGQQCESEGREYLKTMAAMEACYQSAARGLAVELDAGRRP